ncbi:MAG TPA: response regulator, partial [Vicinamibacterales bacterium]|nr:response regulator [Vicinamibacterales bacterium]
AVKFTDEGGQIAVTADHDGEFALIRVRDNGVGMSADLIGAVFDLFTQADRSLDRSQGGLGIGLTLVRLLVEGHGGRVDAWSDGPGKGSEFIVRLPLAKPGMLQPAKPRVDTGEPVNGDAVALRVLIVEDSVDSAEMLAFMLELRGYATQFVHDAPAALEAARQFRPHVILCDIGLPGMSGYELAQHLRAESRARLVALSGYGQEEDRRRSKAAGFDQHLVKPVEPAALFELLASFQRLDAGQGSGR